MRNDYKTIVKLTLILQHKLENMTDEELESFLKYHVLEYNGKIYGRESNAKTISKKSKDEEVIESPIV